MIRLVSCEQARRRCLGYSLIEVLLAVTIISIVLTAVAVSMQTMYRADRQLKDNAAYGQVVPRLSLQLRTDVHAASEAVVVNAPRAAAGVVLTLATSGELIEYQSEAGRVIRTRRRDQEELGREVFSLGKDATLQWRTVEAPTPMVELEIVRAMGKIDAADSRQVDRVVAAIGIRQPRQQEGGADASIE